MAIFNAVLVETYKYLVKKNILVGVPNLLDIARGKIFGARQAQIEGYVEGLPVGIRDVSELGVNTIPIPPISGTSMSFVSSDINDTILGSGARKVRIEYIEPVTELLKSVEYETNGTTPVLITESIGFVSDFFVSDDATFDGVAAGDITIYDTATPATVYCVIKAGGNKSLQLYRYIPKGSHFYLSSMTVSGDTKGITVRLRSNLSDNLTRVNCFIFRHVTIMNDAPTDIHFVPPMVMTQQTYMKVTAFTPSGKSGGKISIGINGWLEAADARYNNVQ